MIPYKCNTGGSVVWAHKLDGFHKRSHIPAMQRCFLLVLTTAWRTTSTEALQVLAGVLPLDLDIIRSVGHWHIKRGLQFSHGDLRVEPLPDDCANDLRHYLTAQRIKFLDQELLRVWQERWDRSTKGRTTYAWMPQTKLATKRERWRDHGRSVTCFITGHGPFNERLQQLGLSETDSCACGETESWEHVMLDCPLYDEFRRELVRGVGGAGMIVDLAGLLAQGKERYERLVMFASRVFGLRNGLEGPVDF